MNPYTFQHRNNLNIFNRVFVLFSIFIFVSCQTKHRVTDIKYTRISVEQTEIDLEMDSFIIPFRNHINHDLDSILAFVPITLEKTKGEWQTNIGNWMADICFEKGNAILNQNSEIQIDMCLFNHGGIRSVIPAGNVSARNAFEVMPFENKLVVAELKGVNIQELVETFVIQKKPHPMSGGQFTFNNKNELISFKINGIPIQKDKKYYVLTSDYLSNGGDYMLFFKKSTRIIPLGIKIRDVLIENLKKNDTIVSFTDSRIISIP